MTSRFKISSKHDISTLTIHVLICWNKVTLFGQVVPMCAGGRTFHFMSLFRRDQDQLGEGRGLSEVRCHHRGGSKWADPF